jgi:dTDP-4-amino-4,6-dideoxygalactose transaminase
VPGEPVSSKCRAEESRDPMTAETVLAPIDVMRPWFGDEEVQALAQVVSSGPLAGGPKVTEFEDNFRAMQEMRYAVATSSGAAALHLALVVAGIGPGDDVLVPSLSFISTANAVTYVGARPVFCDVDPATGNVTAETIHAALTLDTRAVIVVDQSGVPVDLNPIRLLCDRHEITLIEEAACGLGSQYKGRPVGTGADLAVWSFQPQMVLTTGEGGMLTTRRADWAARARTLRQQAVSIRSAPCRSSVPPAEVCLEVGFDYRMTDLQAAVGVVQLGRLTQVVHRRREIAAAYIEGLTGLKGLRMVADPPYGYSNFQSFWLEVLPGFATSRDGLLSRLAQAGIAGRRGTMAGHLQPVYRWRDTGNPGLPHSERLSERTLILPVYHDLDTHGVNRVIACIRAAAEVVQ